MENDLIIEIENGMKTIYCPNGHYITRFKDTDYIGNFSATRKIFCNENADTSDLRCITEEEYNAYLVQKAEAAELAQQKAVEHEQMEEDGFTDIKLGE